MNLSQRQHVSTGTPWEAAVGYSRALRVGPFVFVTGTMAADASGAIVGVGDAAAQTRYAFEKMAAALEQCGASMPDVVRTRMYLTDISDQAAVGAVHREFFGDIRPCATMVEVSALATPDALIEIEIDAIVPEAH